MYKYEAFITSGLREPGLARAGVKVQSKVLISAQGGDTYLLKVIPIKCLEFFFSQDKQQVNCVDDYQATLSLVLVA